ncbi:MAG: hypothetical protein H0X17_00600 [Deltaproteobacteria bacterium]|nr:hypothetical protein [Deltaproteobacteria bacterium]
MPVRVLAALLIVLAACGGAAPGAVENRGGVSAMRCSLPARIEREARRYGSVDGNHPDYLTWSQWRVGLQLAEISPERVQGSLAMVGDDLTWTFDVAGTFDHARCRLSLIAAAHDPFSLDVTLPPGGAITGRIRSTDADWLLGPPFPARR